MREINKKGFMRVVEATVAVLIIFGALLILSANKDPRIERDLAEILPPFLDEIAHDGNMRSDVVENYDTDEEYSLDNNAVIISNLEGFLGERIQNPALDYSVRVCELDQVCFLEPYPEEAEEIFAAERVVSASANSSADYSPRKIKLFLWRRY